MTEPVEMGRSGNRQRLWRGEKDHVSDHYMEMKVKVSTSIKSWMQMNRLVR